MVVDRFTESGHIILAKCTDWAKDYSRIFIEDIVCLFDRDAQSTFGFRRSFKNGLGTKIKLSTAFHPLTDSQAENTIQTLQDMVRECIIDFKGNWDNNFLWWSFLTTIVSFIRIKVNL